MDSKGYFQQFLKVDDLGDEKLQAKIVDVTEGKYGLILHLDSDWQFTLNATNWRRLSKAYGTATNDWLEKTIELSAGEAPYKGEMVPSVILTPISKALADNERTLPKPRPAEGPIDDDIPF